jgi:GH24 family phage-related lysozyme (muramidase)
LKLSDCEILATQVSFTSTPFSFRNTLPNGAYHLRVNAIVNTTVGANTTIQNISGRGADFTWTRPITGCGPGLRPDPFIANTNPTSLIITQPYGGQIFPLSHSQIFVAWGWRNRHNAGGQKISSMSFQVINATSGLPVVGVAPMNLDSNDLFDGSVWVDPLALGLQGNQSYKIWATYVNGEQDAGIPAGSVVSYISEEFNIVNSSVNCTAINNPTKCSTGVNGAAVTLIKMFEGFVPTPSPDPIGLLTVGYGHKCQQTNCAEVPFPFPLSEPNASALLTTDLKRFTGCINNNTSPRVVLDDNQLGALSSFTLNLGCGRYKNSTLLRRLNNGEDPNTVAAQELPKWVKAQNATLPGLVTRRAAEVTLFQTPSKIITNPCTYV